MTHLHQTQARPIAATSIRLDNMLFSADNRIGFSSALPFCLKYEKLQLMKPVLATNDPVLMSYACHLLNENNIGYFIADNHISTIEGSIGAFPQRLMVENFHLNSAKTVLGNASITILGT